MTKVLICYIPEGPSDNVIHMFERMAWEGKMYSLMAELEDAGYVLTSESDGLFPEGKRFYAVFDNKADAALFKLTHL